MIKLGEMQELEIVRKKEFGVFLAEKADSEESVLLPAKQVPETAAVGDRINVFIYRDSKDRLIATTNTPKIRKGECAILKVSDVTKIGAFLDMGLEKELLLPFKEQNHPVRIGEECLVALYIDKSGRLAATMKVYPYLSAESPYKKEDKVEGRVYEVNEDMGVFVAVDDRYFGLIPRSEVYENFAPGDVIRARVMRVREDGKLDLSPREKAWMQMDTDAEMVMRVIEEYAGVLPFNDRVSPEVIRREFNLSKNAFKRAVGHLLKAGRIEITETSIRKKNG
ncbi:MAG: S1 RNA-binding domain-containing protein [Clostridium sp.]|nr:S1 RNA-binding domain-containing protein [Clostridium sp.]MBP3215067.1 S1 RNA-binding domain-containing protein [Clostridium sp.]MBQ5420957.1 S1 RNA-binding domain-containing protein [Clostridium sp.]HAE81602.1 RNA-binding protein [Lachnoclostridium sp.]